MAEKNALRRAYKKADEYVNNLAIGLGSGITNQLEGLYQMGAHPVNTLQGFGQLAMNPGQIPGMVSNALVDTARRATSGPVGLGEVVGENLSPGMFRRGPRQMDATVYHGSPHRINNVDDAHPMGKFDLSKVGTGEGAQAYGHGIYLAENPRVAKEYAEKLSVNASWPMSGYNSVEKANPELLQEIMAAVGNDPSRINRAVIKPTEFREISPDLKKRINAFKKDYRGNFYTVDLPDEHIAKMLDWDAPLSEQPESVRRAFREAFQDSAEFDIDEHLKRYYGPDESGSFMRADDMSGQSAYKRLAEITGNDAYASLALRNAGIPGIRYFDGGSRAAGQGTRNFVIFDGDTAKILKRE